MARPAPGAERTVALVSFLSEHPDRSFGLAELTRHLDLNAATAHALVHALAAAGWLRREPTTKTYRLGPALIAVGHAAGGAPQLLDEARTHMRRVSDELGVTVLATVPMGDEFVIVEIEGQLGGDGIQVGQRMPLAPPLGTIYHAWSTPDAVERWLHTFDQSLGEDRLDHYREVIAAIRQRGYSVVLGNTRDLEDALRTLAADRSNPKLRAAVDQVLRAIDDRGDDHLLIDIGASLEPHLVRAIAAPVFDREGRVALVLALTGLPASMSGIDIARHGRRLLAATTQTTDATGGRNPEAAER